jgi:two-component system sensor histidine kinase RegB
MQTVLNSCLKFFRFPFLQSHAEQAKVLWLVQLRWLAILLFIVFGAFGFFFHAIPQPNFSAYMGLTSILILFNFFSQIFYLNQKRVVTPVETCFQLGFDLLILTSFLYFTHSVENPFIALFFLNACLGGLLIPGYLSLPFVLLIHALLATLQLEYVQSIPGAPTAHSLLLNFAVSHILVFGFWVVMRSLGYEFERQREKQTTDRVIIERQDRLRALGALSAGFSHEFASPLNTAKIRLQRLSRSHANDEDVTEARHAIEVCETVLGQMNASQVDARSFAMKNVNVANLLRDLIEIWKTDHPDALIQVEVKDQGTTDLPPVNFAQVVLNLLDNAYESEPGKPIQVKLVREGQRLMLSIEDSGAGFSPIVIEKMGEPFVTTKVEGTGLGLYVSHLFAQSLGGELNIENTDTGARVNLIWPFTEVRHG